MIMFNQVSLSFEFCTIMNNHIPEAKIIVDNLSKHIPKPPVEGPTPSRGAIL